MSGIIYNTMPVDYPVTRTEALLFLKQNSGTPDDSLVDDLIAMATQEVELITEHQLQEATSIQYFDGFCKRGGLLKLKRPPVSSITSVKYLDVNGVEQTISSSNYRLINKNEASAFVQFNSTYILPIVDRNVLDTVYVEFVSGYETWNDSKPGVPVPIKKAILISLPAKSLSESNVTFPASTLNSVFAFTLTYPVPSGGVPVPVAIRSIDMADNIILPLGA